MGGIRVYLKLNGVEMNCAGDERWGDLLSRLPDGGAGALGVIVGFAAKKERLNTMFGTMSVSAQAAIASIIIMVAKSPGILAAIR